MTRLMTVSDRPFSGTFALKESRAAPDDYRILLFAPTGNDAKLTASVLGQAGMQVRVCHDMPGLCREASQACGMILLAEETLGSQSVNALVETLARQPEWSDTPICIITSGGEVTQERLRQLGAFGPGGNVTLLERPFRPGTLSSTVEVALRARRRQYEVRDLLQKIQDQARLFDATLSHITDLAYTFDTGGRFIYANRTFLDLLGLRIEQVLGKTCFDLQYPPELAKKIQAEIQEVVSTRKAVGGGTYLVDVHGREDYHEYIFSPVFDPAGNVSAVTGISRLVTERKRAEAASDGQRRVLQLMAEDASLEAILNAIVEMVEATTFHKLYASILLLDEPGQCLRHGAAPSLPAAYNQAIDGMKIGPMAGSCGTAAYTRTPVYVSDISNDPRWADIASLARKNGLRACWSTPIFSGQGAVLGTFAMYFNEPREPRPEDLKIVETAIRTASVAIERKLATTALRESEEHFRTMADNISQIAWITDAQGNRTWFNRRWLEYTGTSFDEVKGWGWTKVHHPDHLDRVVNKITHCLKTGEVWEDTYPLRGRDGRYRWFLSSAVPIRDNEGRVLRWFGTNTDITDRLETQNMLERIVKERTAELSETNAQLETLVYSIAHDLRAPLRSMQAFANILLEDYASRLDATAEQYAHRIIRSAEKMDSLVLDLLNYGRVARADMVLKAVDMEALWQGAVTQFEQIIQEKGATIETKLPLPHVRAHEATLGQVLANLLGNALKFNAPGKKPHVLLRAEELPDAIRVWVEDNGIGIPPQYHERVFRVFERLHSKEYEGTGIGLSIVRKGVERMEGRTGLESDGKGAGSRFWIELPKALP